MWADSMARASEDYLAIGRRAILDLLRKHPTPTLENFAQLQTDLNIEQEKLSTVFGSLVSTGEIRYKGFGYEVVSED
jgi:hypothetical protein